MEAPQHMLSRGLWEDITLPALKKVSVVKLCTGHEATSGFRTGLYEQPDQQVSQSCSALQVHTTSAVRMFLLVFYS